MMDLDPQSALSILCGLWFLPHAVLKTINADKAQATFVDAGFRPGIMFLYLTLAIEVAAAIGLIFNIYPRIAAAGGVFVLVGACYAALKMNGWAWRWNKQGLEFMLF